MTRIRCMSYLYWWGLLMLVEWAPVKAQSAAKLTLQLVPTRYSSRTSPDPSLNCSHFHVLLTNTSAAPIALFEEWNSWGYYGLSFTLTYPDGRTVRAVKRPRGWDKNFPSSVTLAPGGFYVFDVDFDPETWQESPLQEKHTPVREQWPADGLRCRMRAIYTIESSEPREASMWTQKGVSVWTGTLMSSERTYILWP